MAAFMDRRYTFDTYLYIGLYTYTLTNTAAV
jgi:hypothetical protein